LKRQHSIASKAVLAGVDYYIMETITERCYSQMLRLLFSSSTTSILQIKVWKKYHDTCVVQQFIFLSEPSSTGFVVVVT